MCQYRSMTGARAILTSPASVGVVPALIAWGFNVSRRRNNSNIINPTLAYNSTLIVEQAVRLIEKRRKVNIKVYLFIA